MNEREWPSDREIQDNQDMLADAIWWLKGFCAAERHEHPDVVMMSGQLSKVREFLQSMKARDEINERQPL